MYTREAVLAKVQEKQALEAQLRDLESQLRELGVDRQEPLITVDGFPRSDIDVGSARLVRRRFAELENDLCALLDEIHQGLKSVLGGPESNGVQEVGRPFCYIESVVDLSPAFECGLCAGDRIIRFGSVDHNNHNALQSLAPETRKEVIEVEVLRGEVTMVLDLRPREWSGAGRLGCRFLPV